MDCSVLHTDVKDSQNALCHLVKFKKMNLQVHSQIQILGSKTIEIRNYFSRGSLQNEAATMHLQMYYNDKLYRSCHCNVTCTSQMKASEKMLKSFLLLKFTKISTQYKTHEPFKVESYFVFYMTVSADYEDMQDFEEVKMVSPSRVCPIKFWGKKLSEWNFFPINVI